MNDAILDVASDAGTLRPEARPIRYVQMSSTSARLFDGRLVHWDEGFRGGWAPAQCTVKADGVVVLAPFLDDDLGLYV